jgi:hypothetical protein
MKMRLNNDFLEDFKTFDFSKIKEKVVFLVGSARFREYFIKIESILQINYEKLVYMASVDGLLNKEKFSEDEWEVLQEIALIKLKNQEAILILDVNGYIGDHTRQEIEVFENKFRRPVYYLSKLRKNSLIGQ